MEGPLWKWTNYWNGWQIRWFVLDNGVLAYYKNQEEVNSGCKGSINVSQCTIDLPANDATRMNISLPGELHMYLRATTSQERQQWVVALGSAKACLISQCQRASGDTDTLKSKRAELRLFSDLLLQQAHQIKESVATMPPDVDKLTDAAGMLSVTCDTFTKTLEEVVKMVEAQTPYEYPHTHVKDVGIVPGRMPKPKPVKAPIKRSPSYETSERKT